MSSQVPALERGLAIVECLAAAGIPSTLTEIGRALGLTPSEVQRPVACLTRCGYLAKNALGQYRLSSKLHRLAHEHPPYRDLLTAALPAMTRFAHETSESVHLAVLSDDGVLLLGDVPGTGLVRISLKMGAQLEAERTVSGRILLAFPNPADRPVRPARAVAAKCRQIHQRGYEYSPSAYADGIFDLGVPVLAPGGFAIAAVTTTFLHIKIERRPPLKHLAPLQACARTISQTFNTD